MSNNDFQELVDFARDKGVKFTQEDVKVSKKKVKILFKAYVGRNVLNEDGFYPIYHKIDDIFLRAVDEIRKE